LLLVDKTYRLGLVAAVIVLLTVLAPLSALAGPGTQPLIMEQLPVLADCAPISDRKLDNIRGRYDTYYFGLDVIVNLTGTGPLFTMTPNPNNTSGTINTGTGISFSDPYVTYQAGIESHNLYQMVQVTGDGKTVRGVMNLDIIVSKAMLNGSLSAINLPRHSLTGLQFRY
jgi:hypothetical protein